MFLKTLQVFNQSSLKPIHVGMNFGQTSQQWNTKWQLWVLRTLLVFLPLQVALLPEPVILWSR
jgi:hypothetical protein